MRSRRTILALATVFGPFFAGAQHPNLKAIDSLRQVLVVTSGEENRINCLNAIAEEYWWPSMTAADTISHWAGIAYKEALALDYLPGKAKSLMLFGVSDLFTKHFNTSEKHLRSALAMYESLQDDFGLGWGNVWLGQALYSQDKFEEALACDKRSDGYMQKTGDWEGQGKVWSWIGMIYATLGNYDSSFYYTSKSLRIREVMSDHICVALSYVNMGQLYKAAGSNRDALDYFNRGIRYAMSHHVYGGTLNWTYFEVVGTMYRLLNLPDSANFYLRQSIHVDSANEMTRVSYGETLLMRGQYDSALAIFLKPVEAMKRGNDNWDLMRVLLDASKTYLSKGQFSVALPYAREAYGIAGKTGARQFTLELYLLLSTLYNKIHENDSAYFYLQHFTALKDSLVTNQFRWKLNIYKEQEDFRNKMEQLANLQIENHAKEAKLKTDRLLAWMLIAGFLVAVVAGFISYKNLLLKRKNETLESQGRQAELQRHVADLEMQALRAQMNPHFIFNCLSSINSFILNNDNDLASTYLTRFSRLVRLVLTNSKKSFIGIEDEIEMLGLYLDMEKLRFKDAFDYTIRYKNCFETENVLVPPLLLQPFAENAIWHGLLHKDGFGELSIELSEQDKMLTCVITDNGVGRERAAAIKSKSSEKRRSMGLQITAERLALLNDEGGKKTFFEIGDVIGKSGEVCGTRVTLRVKYRELAEADPQFGQL